MDGTSSGYNAAGSALALGVRHGNAADVQQALLAARRRTLALADAWQAALGRKRPQVPYDAGLNPPLWELGHLAWFQERWIVRNRQRVRGADCDPDAPRADSVLPASDAWYDSSLVPHATRWSLPLPDAAGTRDYLQRTLARTLACLEDLPPDAGDAALYFFRLAALHEEMHAEAAFYMGRALDIPLGEPEARGCTGDGRDLPLLRQQFQLGAPATGFAFDNELQAQQLTVGPAWIDAEPVTWGRYLPFVQAGGRLPLYVRRASSHSTVPPASALAGWVSGAGLPGTASAGRAGNARPPATTDTGWEQRRGGRWQPLRLHDAVMHVSAQDAEEWCRWAGRRLPTEAEWECAALTLPGFRWGQVWEWTASGFERYPGFVPHPYRDYSQPWFGTRQVLRGASFATAASLAHARYRNFFEPHRRDVFAGFRSIRTHDEPAAVAV